MAYKLIALDLDDTLLNDQLVIPQRVKDAIKKAVDRGIYVVLCTGRIRKGTLRFYEELGLDTLMITTGGALIYDAQGKIKYSRSVEPKLIKQLIDYAKENDLHVQVYLDGDLVYRKRTKYSDLYESVCGLQGYEKADLFEMESIDTPKLLYITELEVMDDLQAKMEKLFPMLNVKRSKPTYLEFASPGVSKGDALSFVAKHYHVDREEVIAVGDAEIDQSMLEYAGLGVAMVNGTPAVKKAADYICPSNNEGGVADVIEKFILEAQHEDKAQNQ